MRHEPVIAEAARTGSVRSLSVRRLLLLLIAMAAVVPLLQWPTFTPDGEKLIVVVYESEQPLPSAITAAVRTLREAGQEVRVVDQNTRTGLDTLPAETRAHIEQASGKTLPWLVVTHAGKVTSSVAATVEALEEAGK